MRTLKEQHHQSETTDIPKCWTGNRGGQPQEMEGAFFYVLTPFHTAELDLGKDSCPPHVLTALTPAAAPLAGRTPARALPDAPVLVYAFWGVPGAERHGGSAEVAAIHRELWSVGGGTGNLAAGTEHSPSCSIKAPAARSSHGAGGVLIVCEIIVN